MHLKNMLNYFVLIIAMAFWGLSWPVSKALVTGVSPWLVGFFRFLFASMIYLPILIITKLDQIRTYNSTLLRDFFVLGTLGIFGYGILFLLGMQRTLASLGSILAGFQPVLISTLAYLIFREKLSAKWRYLGFIFSITGVLVIIGIQPLLKFNREHFLGNLLVICALLCFSLYSIYGKQVMKKISSFESTVGATVTGMLMFGLGAVIENRWDTLKDVESTFWVGILVLAIGTTVIGFFFYFYAIQHIGTTRTGVFINLVPIFGTFFSVILLNEPLSWSLLIGLICVSIGIIIINYPKKNHNQIMIPSEIDENERKKG